MNRNPHQLAEDLLTLSEEYSRCISDLIELTTSQAKFFNENRVNHKSDTACERSFLVTTDGVKMTNTELRMKAIDRELAAIKNYLRVLENEAKNLY